MACANREAAIKSLGKGGVGGPGEGEERTLFKGFFLPFPPPPEARNHRRACQARSSREPRRSRLPVVKTMSAPVRERMHCPVRSSGELF